MIYSVHQPHYLPYPGYLGKVALSDRFVFLENVQFVKREWQNRNKVKGPQGALWLTVPVKGPSRSAISAMEVDDSKDWRRKHVETLHRFYAKADHHQELEAFAAMLRPPAQSLAELTVRTTGWFLDRFGITTPRRLQGDFEGLPEEPNERIIEIGRRLGADTYLAGSGGRHYMDMERFDRAGIEVRFFEAPEITYPQLHGDFLPNLGAIDLLLNAGPDGFDRHVRPALRGTVHQGETG